MMGHVKQVLRCGQSYLPIIKHEFGAIKIKTTTTGSYRTFMANSSPSTFQNSIPVPPISSWNLQTSLLPLSLKPGFQINGMQDPLRNPSKIPIIQPNSDKEYKIPGAISRRVFEEPVSSFWTPTIEEAPSVNSIESTEKQAARLIVIRRHKMNKHKLQKLRKKMKFRWAKVKERRNMRREKAYLDSKMLLIHQAKKFDAKEYVASVIRRAKEEPIPRKWQDPIMPEWFKEQEMAKEIKNERYQKLINLYLNKSIKFFRALQETLELEYKPLQPKAPDF